MLSEEFNFETEINWRIFDTHLWAAGPHFSHAIIELNSVPIDMTNFGGFFDPDRLGDMNLDKEGHLLPCSGWHNALLLQQMKVAEIRAE